MGTSGTITVLRENAGPHSFLARPFVLEHTIRELVSSLVASRVREPLLLNPLC